MNIHLMCIIIMHLMSKVIISLKQRSTEWVKTPKLKILVMNIKNPDLQNYRNQNYTTPTSDLTNEIGISLSP